MAVDEEIPHLAPLRAFRLAPGTAKGLAGDLEFDLWTRDEVEIPFGMPIGAPMTFNARSTAEQVTGGLDLSGKVAVVTGISSGLGFETMRVLCLRGARVIGLASSLEKAREACGRVAGETMPVTCDLSDWASVLAAALVIR
jgi:hypothetical protein